MAFCKSCGTEIGEAKFCPACGTSQDVAPAAPVLDTYTQPVYDEPISVQPISAEPISAPVYTPTPPAYSSTGDSYGSSSTQVPPVYTAPVYSSTPSDLPSTTGQTVFSIINIALGFILCCCYGVSIISLILGIVALVFTNQAKKAATTEEALQKIKSAKIMNIIGVAFLVLAVIITIVVFAISGTSQWTDVLNNYGYSY